MSNMTVRILFALLAPCALSGVAALELKLDKRDFLQPHTQFGREQGISRRAINDVHVAAYKDVYAHHYPRHYVAAKIDS